MAFDKVGAIAGNEGDTRKIVGLVRQLAERINGLSAFMLSFLSAATAAAARALLGISGGYDLGLQNGVISVTAASSALTIALKTQAGADPSSSDPVTVNFRNVTGTTGDVTTLSITAATSLVLSSGSTLGVTSSTAFRLWIVGFNDGGTFRIGAINCANLTTSKFSSLVEGLASSTAEGGAGGADSSGVIYTDNAVSSKAMRILGYAEWNSTGLTAGTWTTSNLLAVQLFGPGVRKPGEVIQSAQTTTLTETTTSSTSYQTTSVSQAITPTSAANVISISANGNGSTGAASETCLAALHRAGSQIGPIGLAFSGAGVALAAMGFTYIDKPNTTSSTTYDIRVKATGISTVTFPNAAGGVAQGGIIVSEIMA